MLGVVSYWSTTLLSGGGGGGGGGEREMDLTKGQTFLVDAFARVANAWLHCVLFHLSGFRSLRFLLIPLSFATRALYACTCLCRHKA
jgi:hypothetical protein